MLKDIDECIIAKEDHDRDVAEYDNPDNIGVYKCVSEDAACRNTIGSYKCSCLVGYIGNPESTITCTADGCPDDHGCIPEPCDLGYYGTKSHGCYKMPEHSTCKVCLKLLSESQAEETSISFFSMLRLTTSGVKMSRFIEVVPVLARYKFIFIYLLT